MKWFQHDSNSSMDSKLQEVLLDYGLEGYGLYWYCLELVAMGVDKQNLTFELEHDARVIARMAGSTPQRVEEMMRRFIELGLFEGNANMITCLSLAKRCDEYTNKLLRNQPVGQSPDRLPIKSALIEENTIQEKTVQENINTSVAKAPAKKGFTPPTIQEVYEYMVEKGLSHQEATVQSDRFWHFYDSKGWKVGKNKMSKWKSSAAGWLSRNKTNQPTNQQPSLDMDDTSWMYNNKGTGL